MYGEIHAAHAEKFREKLTEGNLCVIKGFFVTSSKNMYKAVEGNFMIKLSPWSKVEVQKDVPAEFPRYAYSLTKFSDLPTMIGRTDMFIGKLTILAHLLHYFLHLYVLQQLWFIYFSSFSIQMLLEYSLEYLICKRFVCLVERRNQTRETSKLLI
jgi:hypothetical protein